MEDFGVYIQPVQHYDVKVLGQILHLHGDLEIRSWQKVLEDEMLKKKYKEDTIDLRLKTPMGGVKKLP